MGGDPLAGQVAIVRRDLNPDEIAIEVQRRDRGGRRRAEAELREAHRLIEASLEELRVLADEQAA